MTWLVTVGFMSLACGRIVRSGVASRVYLLGVDSLGVTQFGIALADDGFVLLGGVVIRKLDQKFGFLEC